MLVVTERAREHLSEILSKWKCERDVAVRFARRGEIMLDIGSPNDMIFYHGARQVLLLDPETARLLQGSRMDLVGSPGLQRLRVTRISSSRRQTRTQQGQ